MLETFAAGGRFFRGNVHSHSTNSDGALPPEAVCRRYEEAGYDFLCLSDHFLDRYGYPITDTTPYRTPGFSTLLGAELHAPANSQGELWHIVGAGLPADFAPPMPGEDGPALARRAAEAGAFVGIAHPEWSGLSPDDGLALDAAHAVEIYNHTCELETARPDGACLLDALLNAGRRLTAYAADDSHFRCEDVGGAWMMVKAESNAPDALLNAMRAGRFYSSQGPVIEDARIEDGHLRVVCKGAVNAALLGRGTRAVYVMGEDLRTVRLPLAPFENDWCRLVLRAADGRRAWSNPLWP